MVVKNAKISENKAKRKVSFRLTVDVYYQGNKCYPSISEHSTARETTSKSLWYLYALQVLFSVVLIDQCVRDNI